MLDYYYLLGVLFIKSLIYSIPLIALLLSALVLKENLINIFSERVKCLKME